MVSENITKSRGARIADSDPILDQKNGVGLP